MTIDIDELLATTASSHELPGIVLAVSRSGRLESVHATGTRVLGEAALPDAESVFRIASMTKSFTASAILLLRDAGRLQLDQPVVDHLPWFDDHTVTIRDLLTMNAGFPTDDPWGDRHEPTPLAEFDAIVARGIRRIRPARQGFEYSNLGYALLGRVITAVTGEEYTAFIQRELLQPLGMSASTFDAARIPSACAAVGYSAGSGTLQPEPVTGFGAFSPMGGLHSSVRDLTTWMGGFLAAFNDERWPHPVTAVSRRDQQQPHTFARLALRTPDAAAASASSLAYGYGLLVEDHSQFGRFVQHSGGYPGFGSHMRWHPATGIGVVALSNRTYAPMGSLVEQVILDLVAAAPPLRDVESLLWPETLTAMENAESLLQQWDDELADRCFAHNLDLDQPRAVRRDAVAQLRALATGSSREAASLSSRSPAHARWRVSGPSGAVSIEVLMSPDPEPRVQMLRYEAVE